MVEKGQTFNYFVSGTPKITLDKLTRSEIISHGQTQWTFGLLVMDVRIILLLWTQVFLKINVLNGKKLMLYFAIFFSNLSMPRLYIILGPIKLATLFGIR